MQSQFYFSSHIYHATVERLEQIAAGHDPECPHAVGTLRTLIIEALGEIGGIWPASIYQGEDDQAGPSIFA